MNKAGHNVSILGNKCYRCNHEWKGNGNQKPTVCPSCFTPYWDKPRRT